VTSELRALRAERGLSLDEAAEASGLSPATISRIENREVKPLLKNVRLLLQAYEAPRDDAERLITWTRRIDTKGWWTTHGGGDLLVPPFRDLLALEEAATTKMSFEALAVPGLFQVEAYAQAILATGRPDLSAEEVAELVRLRLDRQMHSSHLEFTAVILEEVLLRPVGGAEVMIQQLQRLASTSTGEQPQTRVRVIPLDLGAHPGVDGPFSILSFPAPDEDVVFVPSASGEEFVEDPNRVARFAEHYRALERQALDESASRSLVLRIIRAMEASA
jgi:transcriptional regulator with XRE-family HTH domain